HQSMLRLSLKALGVTVFPNAAATAPDMDEFLVTGTSIPVASVVISPASADIQVGQTVQFSAAPKDSNGNVLTGRPITWASGNPLSGRVITWASSDTGVATVSGGGLVRGVRPGAATITATSEGKSGTAPITVLVPVASVAVSPASGNVPVGQTLQLEATPKDA